VSRGGIGGWGAFAAAGEVAGVEPGDEVTQGGQGVVVLVHRVLPVTLLRSVGVAVQARLGHQVVLHLGQHPALGEQRVRGDQPGGATGAEDADGQFAQAELPQPEPGHRAAREAADRADPDGRLARGRRGHLGKREFG
jgi:hypothetical protein